MKKSLALIALMAVCSIASAKGGGHGGGSHSGGHSSYGKSSSSGSHSVSGYTRKDGTYVAPAHATNPNSSKHDNWTTKGNVNPHTGKAGTKEP